MQVGDIGERLGLAMQRTVGQPHVQIEFARQPRHPADVIAVFVSDDYAAQLIGHHAQLFQTKNSILQAETAVHQH